MHAGRGNQGGQQDGDATGTAQVDAEGAYLIVAERQDVHAPAHRQQQQDAGAGHEGELGERIDAYVLQSPSARTQSEPAGFPGFAMNLPRPGPRCRNRPRSRRARASGWILAQTRDGDGQQYGNQAAGQGGTLNGDGGAPPSRMAVAAPRRPPEKHPEGSRGNQGVAEDRLEGGTGNSRAAQSGCQQARGIRTVSSMFSAGLLQTLQVHAEPVLAEDSEQLVQFERVPAGDE